jgi:hypothetical protein
VGGVRGGGGMGLETVRGVPVEWEEKEKAFEKKEENILFSTEKKPLVVELCLAEDN